MYENFKNLHPIDMSHISMEKITYHSERYQPNYYEGTAWVPFCNSLKIDEESSRSMIAAEYTGWRDESLATQLTCAITTVLNPLRTLRVWGKDAAAFLKRNMVNNFDRFPVNTTKHGVVTTEKGTIGATGVLMRTGEEEFELFAFVPILNYRYDQQKNDYQDLHMEDIYDRQFVFQMMGPKSLEIVEEAVGEDIHDLTFTHIIYAEIEGHKVRILRFGMHGGLGYEIHGQCEYAEVIHRKIIEVGAKYGIRLLGNTAYLLSHTPGGSYQFVMHYDSDLSELPYEYFLNAEGQNQVSFGWTGSAASSPLGTTMNPYQIGLGNVINYNHDFTGRDALLKFKETETKRTVTLKWNKNDILDVYASQFDPEEEPYQQFDQPGQNYIMENAIAKSKDFVMNSRGDVIGTSSGRTFSAFHGVMLSLATIEQEYTELGTEVIVLWGDEGTRQKKIRAIVVPTPYNTNYSNKTFDVNTIPRLSEKEEEKR